jgi:hypothetical protein
MAILTCAGISHSLCCDTLRGRTSRRLGGCNHGKGHQGVDPRAGKSLCLVNLTHGTTLPARLVTGLWSRTHALRPALVGGCRPWQLLEFLPETRWQVAYINVVTAFGVPSEIVIASKQPEK